MTAPTPNAALAYRNPYWDEVAEHARYEERHPWDKGLFVGNYRGDRDREVFIRRDELTSRYAWTITDPETVAFVVEHCGPRVIDPMAGSGYWAWLLRQHGVNVVASDIDPPGIGSRNQWHREDTLHAEVSKADAAQAVAAAGKRTLLLSWPPYDRPAGAETIAAYPGSRIVYIGEGEYGCCGDDDMWSLLGSGWHQVAEHRPVQWFGLHDWVTVYERGPRPDGGDDQAVTP